MKHDAKIARPVADMSEDEFTDWLCALPPPPGRPLTNEEFAASIARARADVEAGRSHPNGSVGEWLKSWGKLDRRTFEEWLANRHE